MQEIRYRPLTWTLLLSIPIAVLGCSPPPDERLIELGQQSCDRQAEQNQTIAEQTRQLTEMSNDFLAAEGQASAETIALQREIAQAEAAAREELLQIQQHLVERRQIANERQRAPIIAAAITQVGLWLVCLAPLALCGYLLYVLRHSADNDAAVTELLIEEIIAEHPRLLPPGPRRAGQRALPDADKAVLAGAADVEQKQVGAEDNYQ